MRRRWSLPISERLSPLSIATVWGGAAVLTDCVPSKTLISTSHSLSRIEVAGGLGVRFDGVKSGHEAVADLGAVNERIVELAAAQSRDIEERLQTVGVRVCRGVGRLVSPARVSMELVCGTTEELDADVVLAVSYTHLTLPTILRV